MQMFGARPDVLKALSLVPVGLPNVLMPR